MGKPITVHRRLQGDVAMFSGDRSLTGQDGARYFAADGAEDDPKFSARLAKRFFDLDPAIDYVYVANNHVLVRRPDGWDDDSLEAAEQALRGFFVFYDGALPDLEAPIGGLGGGIHMAEPAVVVTEVPEDEIVKLRAEHYNATIASIKPVYESLWIIDVQPDDTSFTYEAGQYTTLGLGFWEPRIDDQVEELDEDQLRKLARRSYSISSSILDENGELLDPTEDTAPEFYIVLVEADWQGTPAVLTPRLFLKKEGDRIFMGRKAAGRYRLDKVDDPNATIVFLSTGTGEAPNNRMTLELLRNEHAGRIVGVCTARYKKDLAYLDTHRTLAERFDNYDYIPLTTREPENEGNKVYIQDLIESGALEEQTGIELDPATTHVFLCGNPLMIGLPEWGDDGTPKFPEPRGVSEILVGRGFTLDHGREVGNIHYEEYW
jgi:ferredoxin/flavodoxin---NADP+ reductase